MRARRTVRLDAAARTSDAEVGCKASRLAPVAQQMLGKSLWDAEKV